MRISHYQTENNLFNPQSFTNDTTLYSDNNFDRSEPFVRLLDLIYKIVEQPQLFHNITQPHFGGKQLDFYHRDYFNFDQSGLENQPSQMEIQNIVEKMTPAPMFKHKTSIQDRMPVEQLNPEVQPTPLSMSIVPSQKDMIVDATIRNLEYDIDLNVSHLRSLFNLDDTNLMVMVLGYLAKLVTLGLGFHFEMNTPLKKFAASYLIASKISYESMDKSVAIRLGEVLGLEGETILSLQKQFLVSMNFHLEISKEYLDEIARILLN